MNTHVSDEIRDKYSQYQFVGKPFTLSNGMRYIRAWHKIKEQTHFYSFTEDFFWWERPDSGFLLNEE